MSKYTSRNIGAHNAKIAKRKQWGIIILLTSVLLFVLAATNLLGFPNNFLLGTLGLAIFPLLLTSTVISIALLQRKAYVFSKRYSFSLLGLFLCLILILQLALASGLGSSFSEYIAGVYTSKVSPGGVLMGIVAYGLSAIITPVGAYVFAAIAALICTGFIVSHFQMMNGFRRISERTISLPDFDYDEMKRRQQAARIQEAEAALKFKEETLKKEREAVSLTLNARQEKSARELAKEKLGMGLASVEELRTINSDEEKSFLFSEEFVKSVKETRTKSNSANRQEAQKPSSYSLFDLVKNKEANIPKPQTGSSQDGRPPKFVHETTKYEQNTHPVNTPKMDSAVLESVNNFTNQTSNFVKETPPAVHPQNNFEQPKTPPQPIINEEKPPFVYEEEVTTFKQEPIIPAPPKPITPAPIIPPEDLTANIDDIIAPINSGINFDAKPDLSNDRFNRNRIAPIQEKPNVQQPDRQYGGQNQNKNSFTQMKIDGIEQDKNKNVTKYSKPSKYHRPPIELLTTTSTQAHETEEDYQTKALILEQTLENFKIPAKVKAITHGPAVTRYELQMPPGIPVKRIAQHADDIAMTLEASGAVRIEAPIPGKGLVGIEVPNAVIATIGLKDIIDSQEFLGNKAPLVFALGKDIAGTNKVCDLNSMPHLLVAGSTGSGKSVCLNTIILSFLYKLSPEDLKLILIDPKRVEFTTYNNLPHMMLPNAITDPEQALNALNWAIKEMERRYELFASKKVRDFKEYNALEEVYSGNEQKLPRIVIIVDELADLMMTAKRDMEEKIKRLAQLARAAGMHLIIATQRPSVDVITGTIKSNLPSRIAFAVTNFADSKTILDSGGADKLLGKGDMLYAPQNLPEPIRVQGAFVSNQEVNSICDYIRQHNESYFDDEQMDLILNGEKKNEIDTGSGEMDGNNYDPLLPQALKLFMETGQGSISMIQRRYSVGFARAARIVDQMELAGFISPSDGSSKNRTIFITPEKYEELFGDNKLNE